MANTHKLNFTAEEIDKILRKADERPFELYYDKGENGITASGYYRIFASAEDLATWKEDPIENAELELFNFVAPAPYSISYTLDSEENRNRYILSGTTGTDIRFTFKTVNEKGEEKPEPVDITFQFGDRVSITKSYNAGEEVIFNVDGDEYLKDGQNIITITLTGQLTKSTDFFNLYYYRILVDLKSKLNIAVPIEKNRPFSVPFALKVVTGEANTSNESDEGSDSGCVVDFIIDGNEELAEKYTAKKDSEDTSKELRGLDPGKHTLQLRAHVQTKKGDFYSNTIYHEIIVKESEDNYNTAITLTYAPGTLINTERSNLVISGERYNVLTIPWGYYSDTYETANVIWKLDDSIVASINASNSSALTNSAPDDLEIMPTKVGLHTLSAYANEKVSVNSDEYVEKLISSYSVSIKENTQGVEETEGAALRLSALGKSNNASNKDSWEDTDHGITTTFNDKFTWTDAQGWNNNTLNISEGAYAEVNYKPFYQDSYPSPTTGTTFEIEFEVFNVNDEDAVLVDISEKDDNGKMTRGIQITGSTAVMSFSGANCSTQFIPNERIKLAFIINKADSESDPRMVYLMNNGVYERAAQYSKGSTGDFFRVNSNIKLGDPNGKASIRIYNIRCYNKALEHKEEFIHYIIDCGTIAESMKRNDIYTSVKSTKVSVDKMKNMLPVMLITGDIEKLLRVTDKTTTIIASKVEFYNPNNNKKNFTILNARMKLQGTSSLRYPRKNFKLYSAKETNSVMYDYNGEVIEGGRYAFADGDVPVKTWTLKADFSDSSCTHNASVARLFGDIEPKVIVSVGEGDKAVNKNVLMTPAQEAAEKYKDATGVDFPYQIRTTPNALAMVMFYRQTETDDWTFMGQYTMLNDKGNDFVYGFRSIYKNGDDPFFFKGSKDKTKLFWDNSNVHCYEILFNYDSRGYSSFESTDGFFNTYEDSDGNTKQMWETSFESRYPELEDGDSYDVRQAAGKPLYDFINWIKTTNPNMPVYPTAPVAIDQTVATEEEIAAYEAELAQYQIDLAEYQEKYDAYLAALPGCRAKFEAECEKHIDLYKCASYYIYYIRFGAVDQVQKNMMWTTYGTKSSTGDFIWFPIRYDNDTILGLNNAGSLRYKYDIERSTPDPNNPAEKCYAGYESWLWNALEASDKFMSIVYQVDSALYAAGLTYSNTCHYFDDLASDQWCECIYNDNQRYKYISPLLSSSEDSGSWLTFLQGKRKSHRHWWLKNRFNLFDARYVSGEYTSRTISGIAAGTPQGSVLKFKAAKDYEFGLMVGKTPITDQIGIACNKGEEFEIVIDRLLKVGDPVYILGANNIEEADMSAMAEHLSSTFSIAGTYDSELGTNLKVLKIGIPESRLGIIENLEDIEFKGFENATRLEYLDIRGLNGEASGAEKHGTDFGGLNLDKLVSLKTFLSKGSALKSFNPAPGITFERLELPDGLTSITMNGCDWDSEKFSFNPANLTTMNFTNMGRNENLKNLIFEWASIQLYGENKDNINWETRQVICDGINWTGVNVDILCDLKEKMGNKLNLQGKIAVINTEHENGELTDAQLQRLTGLFGENVFNKELSPALYMSAPDHIYFYSDKTEILEGESIKFHSIVFTTDETGSGQTLYSIEGDIKHGDSIDKNGLFTTRETGGEDQVVKVNVAYVREYYIEETDEPQYSRTQTSIYITVHKRIYVDSIEITGKDVILNERPTVYGFTTVPDIESITGIYTSKVWELTGFDEELAKIQSQTEESCTLICHPNTISSEVVGKLKVTFYRGEEEAATAEKDIIVRNASIAVSKSTNPVLMGILYNAGLCAHEDYMTKQEAIVLGPEAFGRGGDVEYDIFRGATQLTSFNEFQYFTGMDKLNSFVFAGLSRLTEITLPISITEIGDGAFYGCNQLSSINIPDGVNKIGDCAFMSCTSLREVIIPEEVETLNDSVFFNSGVKSLGEENEHVDHKVAWIEDNELKFVLGTFDGTYTIPETITSINNYCFNNCSSLRELVVPNTSLLPSSTYFGKCTASLSGDDIVYKRFERNGVTSEYGVAWKIGSTLKGVLLSVEEFTISDDITEIGDYAFQSGTYRTYSCSASTDNSITKWIISVNEESYGSHVSVTLSDTVTRVGIGAFKNNKNLTSINLGNSVTVLDTNCFENCESLSTLTIPASVTTIKPYILSGCTNIQTIIFKPRTQTLKLEKNALAYNSISSITIPSTVKNLPEGCFNSCGYLTSIVIPETINTVGNSCFSQCSSLSTLTIKDGVTSLGSSCFNQCPSLKTVNIPDSVNYIGSSCFAYCSGLNNVKLPSTIKTINQSTFRYCTSLVTISIPENVITLQSYVFQGCTKLSIIEIPHVISVGTDCFSGCTNLSIVELSENLSTLGNNCFKECTSLSSITIPNKITYIPQSLFENCSGLISIEMSENVTVFGKNCFKGCTSLANIKIPEKLETLSESSFEGCSAIRYFYISPNIQSIGASCFKGCSQLSTICCPSYNPPTIGTGAFGTDYTNYVGKNGINNILYIPNFSRKQYESNSVWKILSTRCNFSFSDGFIRNEDLIMSPRVTTTMFKGSTLNFRAKNTADVSTSTVFSYSLTCEGETINTTEDGYWIGGTEESPFIKLNKNTGNLSIISMVVGDSSISDYTITVTATSDADSSKSISRTFLVTSNYGEVVISSETNKDVMDLCYEQGWAADENRMYEYECKEVSQIGKTFSKKEITTFNEFRYFSNMDELSAECFLGCTSLRSISLPESGITKIGDYSFSGCTSLTSINIPENIIETGVGSFKECKELATVSLPEGIKKLGDFTFNDCDKIVNTINLWSVEYIGEECFYNNMFTEITIPDTVTYIGPGAFKNCSHLTSIDIPDNITELNSYTFNQCTNLTSITLPSGLKSIGANCFEYCSNLTVNLPDSVEYIYDDALSNLGNFILTDINATLPSSIKYIGARAYLGTKMKGKLIIPDGLVTIGSSAFDSASNLTGISISRNSKLQTINDSAFSDCKNIESIETLPITLTYLGSNSFKGCNALKRIELPDSLEYIGDCCFQSCEELKKIVIPDKITSLPSYCFSDCSNLTEITIPSGITSIGFECFSGCNSVTDIYTKMLTSPNMSNDINISAFDLEISNVTKGNKLSDIKNNADVFTLYSTNTEDSAQVTNILNWAEGNNIYYPDILTFTSAKTATSNVRVKCLNNCYLKINCDSVLGGGDTLKITLDDINIYEEVVYATKDSSVTNEYNKEIYQYLPQGEHTLQLYFRKSKYTNRDVKIGLEIYDNVEFTYSSTKANGFADNEQKKTLYIVNGSKYYENMLTIYGSLISAKGFSLSDNSSPWYLDGGNGMIMTPSTEDIIVYSGETLDFDASDLNYPMNTITYELWETGIKCDEEDGIYYIKDTNNNILISMDKATGHLSVSDKEQEEREVTVKAVNESEPSRTISKNITISGYQDSIIATSTTNPELLRIAKINGWCVKDETGNSLYKSDCRVVTDVNFRQNTSLTSFEELQYFTGLTTLSDTAFLGCTSLTSVILPKYLREIGSECFSGCTSLTNIGDSEFIIPESVNVIGNSAFANTAITSIELPENLDSIGTQCFLGCTHLTKITSLSKKAPTAGAYAFGNSSSNRVGSSESGDKYLYTVTDSYGYNVVGSVWNTLLTSCGFTNSEII